MSQTAIEPPAPAAAATAASSPIEPFEIATNDESQEETHEYPTGLKFAITIASLVAVLVLGGLDLSIVSTAIPAITDHFHTVSDIGWYVSAYRLTSCSLQFFFGKLYTLYRPKYVFMSALAIFEIGSLICATAPTSKVFVFGRAVGGVGCAGFISGMFTIVAFIVPVRKRSIYFAIGGFGETMASLSGPVIGGVLTDKLSWRACFWINIPLGVIALIVLAITFEDPRIKHDRHLTTLEKLKLIDLPGSVLFLPSMTCLLLALQEGGTTYAWNSAPIVIFFVVSILLLIAFGYWQYRRGDAAAVPFRILTQRSILFGTLFAFMNNGAATITDNYLSIYFQAVKGVSASRSGILLTPMIAGLAVSCLISGFGISIVGYYVPFMLFTSIVGPVASGLLTTLRVNQSLAAILCYEALLGFAIGIGIQAPQTAAATVFSAKDSATASAVLQFGQGIGPAIFITAAQAIFTSRLISDINQQAPGVNAVNIEKMGLSDIRQNLGSKRLENVLLGYDDAIVQTMYLPVAMTAISLVGALGTEWRSVKKRRD